MDELLNWLQTIGRESFKEGGELSEGYMKLTEDVKKVPYTNVENAKYGRNKKIKNQYNRINKRVGEYIESDKFRERTKNFQNTLDYNIPDIFNFITEPRADLRTRDIVNEVKDRYNNSPNVYSGNLEQNTHAKYYGNNSDYPNSIVIDPVNQKRYGDYRDSIGHEIGHSLYEREISGEVDGYGVIGNRIDNTWGSKERENLIESAKNRVKNKVNDEFVDYLFQPKELRSNVWGTRFLLDDVINEMKTEDSKYYNKEVVDWVRSTDLESPVEGDFTREHLDLFKYVKEQTGGNNFNIILEEGGKEGEKMMIDLMNAIADNKRKQNNKNYFG